MSELLQHPAVQGAVAPLVVALAVALPLARTRFAWLAIIAAYATMIALTTGFSFSPLSAPRKILLLALLAPALGVTVDLLARHPRLTSVVTASAMGVASLWVFAPALRQHEAANAYLTAAGIALFVAGLMAIISQLRQDGLRLAAAGIGLGLAIGVSAFLSASIGFLLGGTALAAGAAALLLVQVVLARELPAGFTGTLSIGVLSALFAAGTLVLAQLPWYALPLLLLTPAIVALPALDRAPRAVHAFVLFVYAIGAAVLPVVATWLAARDS